MFWVLKHLVQGYNMIDRKRVLSSTTNDCRIIYFWPNPHCTKTKSQARPTIWSRDRSLLYITTSYFSLYFTIDIYIYEMSSPVSNGHFIILLPYTSIPFVMEIKNASMPFFILQLEQRSITAENSICPCKLLIFIAK